MEQLIMYKEDREERSGNSLLPCSKGTEVEVKTLAKKLNRLPMSVTDELIRFALDHVIVKDKQRELTEAFRRLQEQE